MKSDRAIHRMANKLLREVGQHSPPVNVELIAEHLGAAVRREESDGEISGALYRLDDGPIIGVNGSHVRERQRFTIAHEIGHLVLHEDPVFVDRVYLAPSSARRPTYLRDARSSQAIDSREIEANKFAAAILMPSTMIRDSLANMQIPVDAEGVRELADCFEVSEQAMGFRLVNIGVPVEQT